VKGGDIEKAKIEGKAAAANREIKTFVSV